MVLSVLSLRYIRARIQCYHTTRKQNVTCSSVWCFYFVQIQNVYVHNRRNTKIDTLSSALVDLSPSSTFSSVTMTLPRLFRWLVWFLQIKYSHQCAHSHIQLTQMRWLNFYWAIMCFLPSAGAAACFAALNLYWQKFYFIHHLQKQKHTISLSFSRFQHSLYIQNFFFLFIYLYIWCACVRKCFFYSFISYHALSFISTSFVQLFN